MFNVSDTVVKRDGTEYKLNVLLMFDGKSSFNVAVYLDGKLEAEGEHAPPPKKSNFKSK